VLLVHYKKEQLMAALLPRRLTGAVVWMEWGPLPADLRTGIGRLIYRFAARRAQAIIAVSESTRRSMLDVGIAGERVTVVPPVVDVAATRYDGAARTRLRREWGAAEDTFVVGCVSRLQARKRIDVVIDSLDHLDGDVRLIIAGEGQELTALRTRARRFGGRVRFVSTPRGYVEAVLSACDVQVVTPGPREGALRSVALGQLAERPVVATSPEGVADMIHPGCGAIIRPADDPGALARCLDAYRLDPGRRAREGRASRVRAVERHAEEVVVREVEDLLRRVHGRGARGTRVG
jgi:glycosyltransferase involved in cell wall biosynthesis